MHIRLSLQAFFYRMPHQYFDNNNQWTLRRAYGTHDELFASMTSCYLGLSIFFLFLTLRPPLSERGGRSVQNSARVSSPLKELSLPLSLPLSLLIPMICYGHSSSRCGSCSTPCLQRFRPTPSLSSPPRNKCTYLFPATVDLVQKRFPSPSLRSVQTRSVILLDSETCTAEQQRYPSSSTLIYRKSPFPNNFSANSVVKDKQTVPNMPWIWNRNKVDEAKKEKTQAYLRCVVDNLLPDYGSYKDNMKDIDDFSNFVVDIQKTQQLRQKKLKDGKPGEVARIDSILERTFSKLVEALNDSRDISMPVGVDVELWAMQLQEKVRSIDPHVFPVTRPASRASRYIPPVIQRTSKRLSDKAVRAMLKNTKYHDFSFTTMGKSSSHHCNRILFIVFAWAIALMGTIISVGFLTNDFIQAQKNLAIQVDRSPATPMMLPAITICSNQGGIPTFGEYPTEQYPGLPLFTVKVYSRGNRSVGLPAQVISYPFAQPFQRNSPVEDAIVSENSMSCNEFGFDVQREMSSLQSTGSGVSLAGLSDSTAGCQYCYRIGVRQQEVLKPHGSDLSAAMFTPDIRMAVSKTRLYDFCWSNNLQRSFYPEQVLASELYAYAAELEQRGILDFNGREYAVLQKTLKSQGVSDHVNFYCNTYFFSGFFYPSLDGANISYRFTGGSKVWTPTGTGPYYSTYSWNRNASLVIGPNREVLERDTYSFGGIRLYVQDPEGMNKSEHVSPRTRFAVLDRSMVSTMYTFKKRLLLGQVKYEVREKVNHNFRSAINLVDTFHLEFDFELFELERIYTYSTMTWSEYVTDVLEYVGLFTGVCIFTLIVAPANQGQIQERSNAER